MTDDFDFDFAVDRGRSASRTKDREPEEAPERQADGRGANGAGTNGRSNGDSNGDTNGSPGNGSRTEATPPLSDDDWLSLGDDEYSPGSLSPLRDRDESPAGPRIPGEGRRFAKEARRRASRRPSPILDLDVERERLEREQAEESDVDFESLLEHQPQKGRVARRGSAIRTAFEGGIQSLRRV